MYTASATLRQLTLCFLISLALAGCSGGGDSAGGDTGASSGGGTGPDVQVEQPGDSAGDGVGTGQDDTPSNEHGGNDDAGGGSSGGSATPPEDEGGGDGGSSTPDPSDDSDEPDQNEEPPVPPPVNDENWYSGEGFTLFRDEVQPLVASECAQCHVGERFGYTSLVRASDGTFDTRQNYDAFLRLISLDAPEHSRLVTKVLPANHGYALEHGAALRLSGESDSRYRTLREWIDTEKAERCPDCGSTAAKAYIAYIDQPSLNWAANREPARLDWWVRRDAKIMLQPVDPDTMQPQGAAIEFLPPSFCGPDQACDFGRIASNYAGTQLAFECRFDWEGGTDWLKPAWNICIAEIGPDGKAINPRFLKSPEDRHHGWTVSRFTPFGLIKADGLPERGAWDNHVGLRKRNDLYPIFSADDTRVIFSSRGADPRTGYTSTRTYHGFEHTNNIVSFLLNGTDGRTMYLNEGGVADAPLLLQNGNLVFHTWNLERTDLHLYTQTTADGMMEIPVLFGNVQGENMWGTITQLANGSLVGMTGRRRGSILNFVPFFADHTLGTGIDPNVTSFRLLDPDLNAEIPATHFAYCNDPPNGENCFTSRFYDDPSYAPNGEALITYHPNRTYYASGEEQDPFWRDYGHNAAAVSQYVPELQVALIDHRGNTEGLLVPAEGRSYRYPVWVGKRQRPWPQPMTTDESQDWAELHIANVPLWFSFGRNSGQNKSGVLNNLSNIVALRVMTKELHGNACTNDQRAYRRLLYPGSGVTSDHPTHLGINNATGYKQWIPAQGANQWGDILLKADGSVRLRLPAGQLLLMQGIDSQGHVVAQRDRVFSLPPGHRVDTSVKRELYQTQCSSCHGAIDGQRYEGLAGLGLFEPGLDFDTLAKSSPAVDLTRNVDTRILTFMHQIRPMLNEHCVSCHSGSNPAAELTLEDTYHPTAYAPRGRFAQAPYVSADYLSYLNSLGSIPESARAYNWSPTIDFLLQGEQAGYRSLVPNQTTPAAGRMPWDPGYQTLFYPYNGGTGQETNYLTDIPYASRLGRGGRFSTGSYLLEILTGRDLDERQDFPCHTNPSSACPSHTNLLTEAQIRMLMAVIDNGFPYMSRCDDRTVPNDGGPNAGEPWGDPVERLVR